MSRNKALLDYAGKRDFARTPEPAAGGVAGGNIFVVQHHWARRDHYDFRLEMDGVLKSWAVTRGPSLDPADKRLAVRTEDHPLSYAAFEGIVPKREYGGGTVMVWDRGVWEPVVENPQAALVEGSLKVRLFGERMRGTWALVRMKPPEGKRENWLLIKEKDGFARRGSGFPEAFDTSIATGRTRAEIEAGMHAKSARTHPKRAAGGTRSIRKVPDFMPPALCESRAAAPEGGWIYEMKYDGYRLQAACAGPEVKLYTRHGHDWTERFPAIAGALADLNLDRALIDGEAVVFDSRGLTDFAALVAALENRRPIAFVAFDILQTGGKDLRTFPLEHRKTKLKQVLAGSDGVTLRLAPWTEGDGAAVFKSAVDGGAEGIVAKKTGAAYPAGRTPLWLKIKGEKREDVVIVGYSPSEKRAFASLAAAVETPDGGLRYAGRFGTGFTAQNLSDIRKKLDALQRHDPPEALAGLDLAPRGIQWVEPVMRAEIQFAGWTGDAQIRQGRFLGWRKDRQDMKSKTPAGLVRRTSRKAHSGPVTPRGTSETLLSRITHGDRVMFPETGMTKRDVAAYYCKTAEYILPHLKDRPVSFVRAPEGLAEETFFQRHPLPGMKRGIGRVPDPAGTHQDYLLINTVEGLITAAQFSVIEFHGWGAVAPDLNAPDRIVFDLDPDDAVPFTRVCEAAYQLRQTLDSIGLTSFAMASGGKGLHVIAPLDRSQDWDIAGEFTAGIARGLARAQPDEFVAVASKARRRGKIFIDWLRNRRSATAIIPWSLRARPGATIATPIPWEDVNRLTRPDTFHAKAPLAASNPWPDFFAVRQRIPEQALSFLRSAVPA